jgi:hypothetical protein
MLFDPAAIVVFFFVIDLRHAPLHRLSMPVSRGFSWPSNTVMEALCRNSIG